MPHIERAERIELTALFENVGTSDSADIYEVELPKHGDPRVFAKPRGKRGLEARGGMVLLKRIAPLGVKVASPEYIVMRDTDPKRLQAGFNKLYRTAEWDDAWIFQICITFYSGKKVLVKNHSRYHRDVSSTDDMMFTPHSDFFKEKSTGEFVRRPLIKYIVVKCENRGNYVKKVDYKYKPKTSKGEKELFEKGEHLRHICVQPWTEAQHPRCVDDDPEMNELLGAFLLGCERVVRKNAGYDDDLIQTFETRLSMIWYSYPVNEKTHTEEFDIYYEYEKPKELKCDDNIFMKDTPYSAGIRRSFAARNNFELKYRTAF